MEWKWDNGVEVYPNFSEFIVECNFQRAVVGKKLSIMHNHTAIDTSFEIPLFL